MNYSREYTIRYSLFTSIGILKLFAIQYSFALYSNK
jgi:hypothetical protein